MIEQEFFGESHDGEILHARIFNFKTNGQETVSVDLLNGKGEVVARFDYRVKPFPNCFYNIKDLIIDAGLIKDDRNPDCPWG